MRDMWRTVVHIQAEAHRRNMNLSRTEVSEILQIVGVKSDAGHIYLNVPVTAVHVYAVPSYLTVEEMRQRVEAENPAHVAALSLASPVSAQIDLDQVTGYPEPTPEPTSETAESIYAEIETARTALREWVMKARARGRWCDDGVNEALGQVGLDPIPTRKCFTLKRKLTDGVGIAEVAVYAFTEEEALEKANWAEASIEYPDPYEVDESMLGDEIEVEVSS